MTPRWLATAFALPLAVAPLSTAGAGAATFIFALSWLFAQGWRNKELALQRPWLPAALLLIVVNFTGLIFTEDLEHAYESINDLHFFILALMGATLDWDLDRFADFVRAILTGLVANAAIGLLQWLRLFPWQPIHPDTGPIGFTGHIYLGMALTFALLWLAYDWKHRVVLPRSVNTILALIFFIQLITTASRAGQLAFVLLFPIALWRLFPGRARYAALAVAVLVIGGMSLSPMLQKRVLMASEDIQQYLSGDQIEATNSLGLRLVFWQGALKLTAEHPLTGIGTGDYAKEMKRLQDSGELPATPGKPQLEHPHNSYLAYLCAFGIPGLAIFLYLCWTLLTEAWPMRDDPAGWFKLSYLMVFLLGSMTDTLIWAYDSGLALGLIAGLSASLLKNKPCPPPANA